MTSHAQRTLFEPAGMPRDVVCMQVTSEVSALEQLCPSLYCSLLLPLFSCRHPCVCRQHIASVEQGWAGLDHSSAMPCEASQMLPVLAVLPQVGDDLNPIRALALLSAISDEDAELLDLAGRPEHLIMTHLPVPPVCIRPSVELDAGGGTNEDDITMKLMARRLHFPATVIMKL